MTNFYLTCIAICLTSLASSSTDVRKPSKPYRLQVLALFHQPETLHKAIGQIILDAVNNHTDLLTDYDIELQIEEEEVGIQATSKVMRFISNPPNDGYRFKAPIIIGPEYTTGCHAIGPILQHINMVDLNVQCGAPDLTNRTRYPNLYMMMETPQFTALAQLRFMRDIGKWNRFAILTYALSVYDYSTALYLHQIAIENGFTVSWFNIAMKVDEELVASLKETDSRIIVVFTSNDMFLFPFLCLAYKFGITGPRYVFIANTAALLKDPRTMPNGYYQGCTLMTMFAQMGQTFWLPKVLEGTPSRVSQVGHGQEEFDNFIRAYPNATSQTQDPNYRFLYYMYYDTILGAIYALNDTEGLLRRTKTLTLRDYRQFPEVVMRAAKEALTNLDIAGISVDRIKFKSGLPANQQQAISQFSLRAGTLVNVAIGSRVANSTNGSDTFALQNYAVKTIRRIQWLSADNTPPRDSPIVRRFVRSVPIEVFTTVVVIAGILSIAQLTTAVTTMLFVKRRVWHNINISQLLVYVGCILTNASAILLVSDGRLGSAIYLMVIGLSSNNGVLALRGVAMKMVGPLVTAASSRGNRPRASTISAKPLLSKSVIWKRFEKITLTGWVITVVIKVAVVYCWLTSETISCDTVPVGKPIYQADLDIVNETVIEVCQSASMTAWLIGLAFLHGFLLLAGCWFAYAAKTSIIFIRRFRRFTYIRFGQSSSAILLFGGFLAVTVLRDPIYERIAIAFVALVNSAATSATSFSFGIRKK